MGNHGAFYKNTAWQYGLQIVKYLFPFITLPYLTRVLEPEGYAVYAYVMSLMTFVQAFVDFGFNLSGTKQIAAAASLREKNEIVGAVTQARVFLCVVSGLVVFVVAWQIPMTHGYLLYTMLAYLGICGKAFAPDFIFMGYENMRPLTTRYLVSKGVSTVLTFIMVHSVADLLWIPVLDILSSAIALIWSFAAAYRMFGVSIVLVSAREVLGELRVSALYCLSNIASTAFNGFTTLFIGIVVTDSTQVSYWSLAMTAVNAVQALYTPITNSLYPHMVKGGDFDFARKLSLVAIPVVFAGTVVFAQLADVIVLVLGGEVYLAGSWIMVWVSPILFFSFFSLLFGWPVLGAAGKVGEITATTVGSSVFCVTCLILTSLAGMSTVQVVCVIRCVTEGLLFVSRLLLSKYLLCYAKPVN